MFVRRVATSLHGLNDTVHFAFSDHVPDSKLPRTHARTSATPARAARRSSGTNPSVAARPACAGAMPRQVHARIRCRRGRRGRSIVVSFRPGIPLVPWTRGLARRLVQPAPQNRFAAAGAELGGVAAAEAVVERVAHACLRFDSSSAA